MRKQGFLRLIFSWVLFFGMLLPPIAAGQTAPLAERQKIESLIKQVGDLKDAKFIRNGSTYEVSSAVRFLRGKWDANTSEVKSARDFIDKVAARRALPANP